MALHLGKSHGRQVNQGRNAFPQATLLSIALLALCTLHAGCAPSTPRDQLAIAAAKPSSETRSKDVTERLKQDVDRLIATDFQDVAGRQYSAPSSIWTTALRRRKRASGKRARRAGR